MNENYYLAPLEGITGHIYRRALHEFFPEGIAKYYTPFLSPNTKYVFDRRQLNQILPEHNEGIYLVPQVLTNNAKDFFRFEEGVKEYGYTEVNINLGCPSGTVTAKGKGSGFLRDKEKLRTFLDEVYSKTTLQVSIKTRLGYENLSEWEELLDIFKDFPISELIIHPRLRSEFYKGPIHVEAFIRALEIMNCPLCFNGEIKRQSDVDGLPSHDAVMIGRGVIEYPGLIRELTTGKKMTPKELLAFSNRLVADYSDEMSGETPVLYKMKEQWAYMKNRFPGKEKEIKKLLKAKHITEYQRYVEEILF